MNKIPAHAIIVGFIGCLAIGGSCTPRTTYDVPPFHDSALLHAPQAPFQHPTVQARAQRSKSTGSTHAQRPTSTASNLGGVIPTRENKSLKTPKSGDGYEPQIALHYIFDTLRFNEVQFQNEASLRIAEVYQALQKQGVLYQGETPAAGDLVFFHNTYDANRDTRNNDWYTHVGIVMSVENDGTIHFLSYRDRRVQQDVMNVQYPHEETRDGKTINTRLRESQSQDPSYTLYLAGELYANFASVLGNARKAAVLEQWQPASRR